MRGWHAAVLVAVIVAATIGLAVMEGARQAESESLADEELADRTAAAFEDVVQGSLNASATAAAIMGDDGLIDADRFEVFAQNVEAQPDVLSVAWELFVPADDRAAFESEVGVVVWEQSPEGDRVPAGARSEYLPVVQS